MGETYRDLAIKKIFELTSKGMQKDAEELLDLIINAVIEALDETTRKTQAW